MTLARLRLFLLILSFVVGAPLVLGFFGRLHPALDSLAHFRFHLAALVAITGVSMLAARLWLNGLVTVAFAVSAVAITFVPAGFVQLGPAIPAPSIGATYRLLQMNLRFNNATPETVLSLIAQQRPDVVTLQEVSPMWEAKLDVIGGAYPYRVVCPAPFFSAAILSRRPFYADTRPLCFGNGALAVASINLAGQPVDVVSLHLKWPWPQGQARQVEWFGEILSRVSDTAILGGDFNATPWSATVLRVAALAGMARLERVGPTWRPRLLPAAFTAIGLPIDQIMSKGGVAIRSSKTLKSTGSDHLPILVEFNVIAAGAGPAVQTVELTRQQ